MHDSPPPLMWPRHGFWGKLPSLCPFPLRLPGFAVLKHYNPDPQLLSKYVIRANVTATKFVCLGKKQATPLPRPHKLCPVKCPQIVLCVGWHIINYMGTVLSYCKIHHLDIFHQKVGQNILTEKYVSWTKCTSIKVRTGTFSLMIEPSCRFSPFLGKRSWTQVKIQIKSLQYISSFLSQKNKNQLQSPECVTPSICSVVLWQGSTHLTGISPLNQY